MMKNKQTNKNKKQQKSQNKKKMKTQSNILSDEHTLKQCLF